MQLLTYRVEDGAIVAVYQSERREMLEANRVAEDAAYGSLLVEEHLPITQQECFEVQAGQLRSKTEVQLRASPVPFAADGLTECQVQLEPFVPCILDINTQQVRLTQEDQQVTLTADSPQSFSIRMVAMPGYWAQPLIVEAR